MPQPDGSWTAEMVRALPSDGKRYEVIDGELFVTPGPSWDHQEAVLTLALQLRRFLEASGLGHIVLGPGDVEFDARNLVEPDIFVTPLVQGRRPRHWHEVERLILVVEVLSPSTARADRTVKRRLYQRRAVPEYWIVDPDARVVERWRPADDRPEILTDALVWHLEGADSPFVLDVLRYFQEVIGG